MQNHSRLILLLIAFFFSSQAKPSFVVAQDINSFYEAVDAFMGEYVSDGLVDYKAIKNEPAQLDRLMAAIASMDRSALSPQDEKAFLINTYNVLVIKNVVAHYPMNSPIEIGGFFDKDRFEVSGEQVTLDGVEKRDLYVKYPDPRLHFVLVCAALGCPQLISKAYRGASLDERLELQTTLALDNSIHVAPGDAGGKVSLTEIFSWYEKDFTAGGGSVVEFVNQYRTEKLPADVKIDYISYDWRLNDRKSKS